MSIEDEKRGMRKLIQYLRKYEAAPRIYDPTMSIGDTLNSILDGVSIDDVVREVLEDEG